MECPSSGIAVCLVPDPDGQPCDCQVPAGFKAHR